MPNVRKLPEETISSIRTAFIVPSLLSCAQELIHNAIDAGATLIEIAISRSRWSVRVEDDGCGISSGDLELVGQRYHTSKSHSLEDLQGLASFGFRGEALASIAEIGILDVVSRHTNSDTTSHIYIRGGERQHCGTAKQDKQLLRHGTVVHVKDLFYKWPVRRKLESTASSMEKMRRMVETLALAYPFICFSLQDLDKAEQPKLIKLKPHLTVEDRWIALYGRSMLKGNKSISMDQGVLKITGLLSPIAAKNKQFQFICLFFCIVALAFETRAPKTDINQRPIVHPALYAAVNSVFAASSFATKAEASIPDTSPTKRIKLASGTRKVQDRHAVFCIFIKLPAELVNIAVEPDKKVVEIQCEDVIVNVLKETTAKFLKDCHFSSAPAPKQPPSTKKASHSGDKPPAAAVQPTFQIKPSPEPIVNPLASGTNDAIRWVDPNSGQVYMIDKRTGHSRTLEAYRQLVREQEMEDDPCAAACERPIRPSRCLPQERPNTAEPDMPEWMTAALSTAENKVFQPRTTHQVDIPVLSCCECTPVSRDIFLPSYESDAVNITRQELASADVLTQVDAKFVLCRLEKDDDTFLVLVDQHAADERIRVERYLSTLCSGPVQTAELPEPHDILMSRSELVTLLDDDEKVAALNHWGIKLDLPQVEEEQDYVQVAVTHVPQVIERRLRAEPQLVRELVGSFVAQLEESGQTLPLANNTSWIGQLGRCPRVLLDLVNSKACRGAIMFNDTLDHSQCQTLIHQLVETKFPFQCAHGRPSLVPLCRLPDETEDNDPRLCIDWVKVKEKMIA